MKMFWGRHWVFRLGITNFTELLDLSLFPVCLLLLAGLVLRRLLQDLLVLPMRLVPDEPGAEDQEEPARRSLSGHHTGHQGLGDNHLGI